MCVVRGLGGLCGPRTLRTCAPLARTANAQLLDVALSCELGEVGVDGDGWVRCLAAERDGGGGGKLETFEDSAEVACRAIMMGLVMKYCR